jgi:hypothetical protein
MATSEGQARNAPNLTSFFSFVSPWYSRVLLFRHYKAVGVFTVAVICFFGSSFQLIPNFS